MSGMHVLTGMLGYRLHLELTEIVDTGVSDAYGDRMSTTIEDRQVRRRLAILRHAEAVTGNVAMTCRYYGIRAA